MDRPKIRWGILGTGKIARKFVSDLAQTSGEAIAVGSRSLEKAASFAKEWNIAQAYGSYEDLVKAPEVEVIYVSSPHSEHLAHALLALKAGKAVLCEKPMAPTLTQVQTMLQEAKAQGVFLMEALWMYFLPTFRQAQKWIAEGKIGEVKQIRAEFGFKADYDPESRLFNPSLAGGALLDIGIYPLTFALRLAGGSLKEHESVLQKAATGVDAGLAYSLEFDNGVVASLHCTFEVDLVNEAIIYGTEGYIRLPLFWKSTEAFLHTSDQVEHFVNGRTTEGYDYEAEAVHACLRARKTECDIMTWAHSEELIRIMDEIRHRHGIQYPFE